MKNTEAQTESGAAVPPFRAGALLKAKQLAQVLNISRRTLSNWTQRRLIPIIRVGRTCRYDLPGVRAALAKHEQPVSGH